MELAPPVDLAELQIAGVLGRGASATVYAAEAAGVALALKVGHRPEHGRRLAQEGRMLLRAQHPAVPRLLGAGWVDASEGGELRPALALARVEGEPLVAQATSAELTVQLGAQLARAVDALHAGGVAHGDLKPENVVVSRGGALHVLDLGLAREAAERELEGATPRYLARGDRDLGDGRQRDLLALGLMLAELAEPTLRGSSELLRDARAASLPAPLGEVCAALLAPSPDARPRAGWVAEAPRVRCLSASRRP
ncbi:MAG: protein kinase [Polyangiaceae bacterium]|nr:protein kinase [Polyangiaceae bacterium]